MQTHTLLIPRIVIVMAEGGFGIFAVNLNFSSLVLQIRSSWLFFNGGILNPGCMTFRRKSVVAGIQYKVHQNGWNTSDHWMVWYLNGIWIPYSPTIKISDKIVAILFLAISLVMWAHFDSWRHGRRCATLRDIYSSQCTTVQYKYRQLVTTCWFANLFS